MSQELFTVPQAAKYCAIGRVTLWKYVKSGELKASVTPGGHYRILKNDLEDFARRKGMYPIATYKPAKKKILIVDDDAEIRKLMEKTFSAYEYETETAAEGSEAGVKVPTFQPGLIILDLHMPGIDGFTVCRQIKQNPATEHIKILAVTGFDSKETHDRIMAEGADGYLAKPVDRETLLRNVEALLSP
jgi:excisionase family DNA binding protein